jgi:Glycosyl hydrolases family 18
MRKLKATWRRWPFEPKRVGGPTPETVSMLDSISLTAFYTEPLKASPRPNAEDVFASMSSQGTVDADLFRTGEQRAVDWGHRFEWGRLPLRKIAVGVGGLALLSGSLAAGVAAATSATTAPPAHVRVADAPVVDHLVAHQGAVNLAPATSAPGPALPRVALAPPTSAHEVFGYAPYWSLPQAPQFPYADFSTIAYFSLDVNPNGSIQMSGPGWDGYESQDLTDLVNTAHIYGDRVVLTVTDFSQSSLDTLTHDPNAGNTLGVQLAELVREKNLDGVNLDLEGTGDADQAGLDHLVSQVDFDLHTTDPHYQLTMATYASSAGDPNGFYDIADLSQWVDAFFVMAYDVDQGSTQGNGNAGGADASYMAQYVAAAGASKVIWGLPLFGYDETTSGPDLGDPPTGPSQAVTDAQATASGTTYWDAATQTAWTSYQAGGQWHQVFFDNVNTLADKVQLAADAHLLGVGAWALGMEGDDDSMLSVLDGGTSPLRTPPAGPAASSTSSTPISELAGNGGTVQSGTPSAPGGQTNVKTDVTTTTRPKGNKGSKGTTTTSSSSTTSTSTTTTTTTTTAPSRSTTTTSGATGGTGANSAPTTTTSSS